MHHHVQKAGDIGFENMRFWCGFGQLFGGFCRHYNSRITSGSVPERCGDRSYSMQQKQYFAGVAKDVPPAARNRLQVAKDQVKFKS
ncbi:hypothetical protein RvVAR031_02690 [Agrobacterium vitis]|nr:hypothetical protein RvVAR031_02690 [Agrobacterium vitis]